MQEENRRRRSAGVPLVTMAGLALVLWVWALIWSVRSGCGGDPRDEDVPVARIDVNTADVATLQVLPSIGPALSRRLVEDRGLNGPFESPEDLLRVKGITKELLRRIRPFLADLPAPHSVEVEAAP